MSQRRLFPTNRNPPQISIKFVCATNPQGLLAKLDAKGVAMKAPSGVADITWRLESDGKFSCMRWNSSHLIYGKKTIDIMQLRDWFRLLQVDDAQTFSGKCSINPIRKGLKQVL